MRYLVAILSLALLVSSCKSRKIETTVAVHQDMSVDEQMGIAEHKDSISVEQVTAIDDDTEEVTETNRVIRYEAGEIKTIEESIKTKSKHKRSEIDTKKVDEVSAERSDTTRLIVKNKIRVLDQHKAESEPNKAIWAAYIIAIMAAILGVLYKLFHNER